MIIPKKHNNRNGSTPTKDANTHGTESASPNERGKSVEGQEGLNFIANWIEMIIQRLQINITGLRMYVRDEDSIKNDDDDDDDDSIKNTLCISIPNIEYYNTHPSSISTSVSLSSSIATNGNHITIIIIIIIILICT